MKNFKKLLFLITPKERKSAGFLLFMMLIMALLDMIGVASILPFVAVLSNPNIIETNMVLNSIFQASRIFEVENREQFLFALGILVFILLVISLSFKALTIYLQTRFVQMLEYSIGKRLIEGYLNQSYSWFLNRHSAELGKTILSEIGTISGGGMKPALEIIARSLMACALISLLILVDPKIALTVGTFLGLAYLFIFFLLRKFLKTLGYKRFKNNKLRFSAVSEAFGAAKEIKIGGLEKIYVKNFSEPAEVFARTQATTQLVSQLPRLILEVIAFGGILLIILYIMSQTGNFNNALPIVSLYVFAGYRLLPAVQEIYASFTSLTFISPSITKLTDDIKNLKTPHNYQDKSNLTLNNAITLKKIFYNYPNSSRTALKDINLNIPAKSIVGFVGATGSGKTTLIDIILGLLEPQEGILLVDKQVLTKNNSRAWQRTIGYVPQHIYLSDDTITANIAFGVDSNLIDQDLVEKAAKIANLHEFVTNELPKQYLTTIGERGVRLSGGQRQRIGIARALYHKPQVLILDEATSALDNETEKVVMDAVHNLNKDITIILIAHRLNTVKKCDIIFKLEKGQLVDHGSYDKIINEKKN